MVQWLNSKIESIAGAAVILAGASLISKLLGLLRNRVLAGTFGAGDTLDAYFAAFRVPDTLFQLVVLGALSAGFIPVLIAVRARKSSKISEIPDQWQVAISVLNALLLLLTPLILGWIIFAPQLQSWLTPGFAPEKLALTVRLARIMAFGPLFLGISAVLSGVLQAYRRFLVYALAPIFYNVGIIFGAVVLVPWLGVRGLGVGVVLGTVLHVLVQLPAAYAVGFRFRLTLHLKDPAVRQIGWLSLPRFFGLAITQLNFLAITWLASGLAPGSLSVFNFANDLQSVPLGLFAIALATAAFPAFSECAARGDKPGLREQFSYTSRMILFLTLPTALLLILLRAQLVRVLLGTGQFDWEDTVATADTLALLSMSLFAQALLPLFARALYALKDTVLPTLSALVSMCVNIAGALVWGPRFGIVGLALAFSLAAVVNLVMHWLSLRWRLDSLGEAAMVPAFFKLTAAGLGMAVVVQSMKFALAPYLDLQTGWGIFLQGLLAGGLGLLVFLLLSLAMNAPEAQALKNAFVKKLFRNEKARPVELVE